VGTTTVLDALGEAIATCAGALMRLKALQTLAQRQAHQGPLAGDSLDAAAAVLLDLQTSIAEARQTLLTVLRSTHEAVTRP
jgi:hypothetical protein